MAYTIRAWIAPQRLPAGLRAKEVSRRSAEKLQLREGENNNRDLSEAPGLNAF